MSKPAIAFLPADSNRILLLKALGMAVPNFNWVATDHQNLLEALAGQGDERDWMTEMVSRAQLVLVGLCEKTTLPGSFDRAWRAALQQSKPVVVLLCEDADIPAELADCPRCDLRVTLGRAVESLAAPRARIGGDNLQQSAVELLAIRKVIEEAWEASLPAEALAELHGALQSLEVSDRSPSDRESLLSRMTVAGRACRLSSRALRLPSH